MRPEKKTSKPRFYGIHRGRETGVVNTWVECKELVNGYKGAVYKQFPSEDKAKYFAETGLDLPIEKNSTNSFEIYTDGACSRNGQSGAVAGIGVWFSNNNPWNVSEPLLGLPQTNQRAEIQAIIRAVETLDIHLVPNDTPVTIYTDSMYCHNAYYKWIKNWISNGWVTTHKEPVLNKKLMQQMYEGLTRRDAKLEYVPGHSGNYGNVEADRLAVKGASLSSGTSC
jgi:ribonuclease HI